MKVIRRGRSLFTASPNLRLNLAPPRHSTTRCRWRSGDWPGGDGHLVVDAPGEPGVDLRHAIHGLGAPDQRRNLAAALHLATQPDDSVADLDLDGTVGDAELPADDVVVDLPAHRGDGPQEHLEQIAAGHDPSQPATGDTVHRRGHHLARAGAGGLVEALAVAGRVNRAGVGGAVRVALLYQQVILGHDAHQPARVVDHR